MRAEYPTFRSVHLTSPFREKAVDVYRIPTARYDSHHDYCLLFYRIYEVVVKSSQQSLT